MLTDPPDVWWSEAGWRVTTASIDYTAGSPGAGGDARSRSPSWLTAVGSRRMGGCRPLVPGHLVVGDPARFARRRHRRPTFGPGSPEGDGPKVDDRRARLALTRAERSALTLAEARQKGLVGSVRAARRVLQVLGNADAQDRREE